MKKHPILPIDLGFHNTKSRKKMSNTNEKILTRQATEQETEQTSRHYGKVPQNNANNRTDNPNEANDTK